MSLDILAVQTNLKIASYYTGVLDGTLGPLSYAALMNFAAGHKDLKATYALAIPLTSDFPKYDIVGKLRLSHFIAQACHETGGFAYNEEIGNKIYFAKYDNRSDLGNNVVGDGALYHGRGIFEITGKYNYQKYGDRISVDLVHNPARAAEPEVSSLIACLYWTDGKINKYADDNDCLSVSKCINLGSAKSKTIPNGYQLRLDLTNKLLSLWDEI